MHSTQHIMPDKSALALPPSKPIAKDTEGYCYVIAVILTQDFLKRIHNHCTTGTSLEPVYGSVVLSKQGFHSPV